VTFTIDSSGVLLSSVHEEGRPVSVVDGWPKPPMPFTEAMQRQLEEDVRQLRERDERERQERQSRNRLESFLLGIESQIADEKLGRRLSEEAKVRLQQTISEGLEWMKGNQHECKDTYDRKLKELQGQLSSALRPIGEEASLAELFEHGDFGL
jgi:molecular chaperone DnaK (HSP70)